MQDFRQLQIESIILSFTNNALIELEVKKYSKCIALVIKKNKKKNFEYNTYMVIITKSSTMVEVFPHFKLEIKKTRFCYFNDRIYYQITLVFSRNIYGSRSQYNSRLWKNR